MHVLISEYKKGDRAAIEFSDDGTKILGDLEGRTTLAERVDAWLRATCDNTEEDYDHLLDALAWLTEEVKKRKASAAKVSA
jgi:hypothetical protein